MAKFAKWLGGGLGWAFFGPLGGLLGFTLGSIIDSAQISTQRVAGQTTVGDFAVSLLVLCAAVMKADGKVMRSELDYVKRYFIQNFGEDGATEALVMLRDLLNQNIPVQDVCLQIKDRLDYSSRLQLLHFLYGIALADDVCSPEEIRVIEDIASFLGISANDQQSIKNMFVPDNDSWYKILEIEQSATNEEVKKAYRRMAMKYHPDKVSYLGDDFKNAAHEKFQKVNEAYEKIKKERGIV
jgi:DnaJ like chaperone protein